MGESTTEVLIVFLLVLVNGSLAMAEMALVSVRKGRLEQLAEDGDARARAALVLVANPGRFLSTVQVGITSVGILAGAFGGATLAEQLAAALSKLAFLAPYAEPVSVGIVVLAITYLSLIIGELAPKQIALQYAERVTLFVALPMQFLARIVHPLVRFLSGSTALVLHILRVRQVADPQITEEEVRLLLRQGAEMGIFERLEESIVGQVFRLGDQPAGALLTPRTEIDWLDLSLPLAVIHDRVRTAQHSYLPVGRGDLDQLLGIVPSRALLAQLLRGEALDVSAECLPPLLVPESTPALQVVEQMKQHRTKIAFVVDEYGGILGMLTAMDLLEALVGELPEARDAGNREAVRRPDGSWLLDGLMTVETFKDLFDLDELPGEKNQLYHTLGGFVMAALDRIPETGARFHWKQLLVEVVDMDGNRVDKVLVTPTPAEPHSEPGEGE